MLLFHRVLCGSFTIVVKFELFTQRQNKLSKGLSDDSILFKNNILI